MNPRAIVGVVIGAGLIAGCGSQGTDGGSGDSATADLPAAVECGTQYRPDAEQMTGAEDATLRVERGDGLAGGTGTLTFERMTVTVTYTGDDAPEGRSVDLQVTSSGGEPLARTLHQVGTTPLQDVDFAGGHGFTGLLYVDHQGAQLQVWCTAVAG